MKGNRFLFGIVVVLLLVTSVLPGCNEERQLVIPSSMEPEEVLIEIANAGPLIQILLYFAGGWTAEDMDPYAMPEGACEEQFIEGFSAILPEFLYIKRNEERVGDRLNKTVSCITVLKYEDIESAERSFVNISETQKLQDSTYGGIALKNGTYTLAPWWEEEWGASDYWDNSTMPCYLIHSDCFVIYFYGREDVDKDILDRIIVAFGVKE